MTSTLTTLTKTRRTPVPVVRPVTQLRWLVRSEITKLRSLRSTWAALIGTIAINLGITAIVAGNIEGADFASDPVGNLTSGFLLTMLLVAVIGALSMTSEYTAGTIRLSLSAVPQRGMVLAAKAIAVTVFVFAAGIVSLILDVILSNAMVSQSIPWTADGGVLRFVYASLLLPMAALLALGLATALRSTVAAVSTIAVLYVVGPIIGAFIPEGVAQFLPSFASAGAVSGANVVSDPNLLGANAGMLVVVTFSALALAAGARRLVRRDA
jgi:ABC-2 type transport system permease protein